MEATMTTIYVKEQGAVIGRDGERLIIRKDGSILESVPFGKINQVVLMGNVQLTTQAATSLLDRNIDVLFLSSYGKYRFRLVGEGSKHASLRQKQLKLSMEASFALKVAKPMVEAKIHNQRLVLQRQTGRLASLEQRDQGVAARPADQQVFDRALAGMMQMRRAALACSNLDSLRGYEGKAAAYYFEAVRSLLHPEWGFEKRAYYPPPDPFNALLSFAYSLLLKDVLAAVNVVGLDPYQGFFHEIDYGRPSMALDLMEEWRPLIADSLALELVNRGSLKPGEFVRSGNPRRPVELGETGVSRVLQAYGQRLETRLHHPLAGPGGQTTLRRALILQARRLVRTIDGRDRTYEALKAR
jgi:CRISP-associated protein Cas1